MFSFRRLLSVYNSGEQQDDRDGPAEIEISDDSNEENGNGLFGINGDAEKEQGSGSDRKKRKRREGKNIFEFPSIYS